MKKDISSEIKRIRDLNKLSQERFGKKIGLSGKAISTYETGRCTPPLKVLENISRTYDVSFTKLNIEGSSKLEQKLQELEKSLVELKRILINVDELTF